jgi:hypothetical protein
MIIIYVTSGIFKYFIEVRGGGKIYDYSYTITPSLQYLIIRY